jgi:hypothetical protein
MFVADACRWSRAALGPRTTGSNYFVFFVVFSGGLDLLALQQVFEWPIEICIERVRPVGVCRKVTPKFVHPEPRRWVLSHIRFKRIPTCLRDLLRAHPTGVADLRVKDKPVTPIRQRFAMRGNYRDAGAFVQPRMRGSNACF